MRVSASNNSMPRTALCAAAERYAHSASDTTKTEVILGTISSMNDYKTTLLAHLATYKRQSLGVHDDGVWSRNNRPYPHILPSEKADLNLVSGVRAIWAANPKTTRVKRHRDFHHLNSSQAFAINLFFPLLHDRDVHALLLRTLGIAAGAVEDWNFEVIIDRVELTNFDVVLQLEGQRRVFIEVKLTESEFGSVSDSDTQRRRREAIYLPRLAAKVTASALEVPGFFKMYQLLRNASYAAADRDQVMFIMPRQNRAVASAAERFTSEVVSEDYRPMIRTVFAEDLVASLLESDLPPNVLDSVAQDLRGQTLRAPHENVCCLIGLREKCSAHTRETGMYSASLGSTT